MPKAIFGAVAATLLLTAGVSAQGHSHGAQQPTADSAQAADSSQTMMQQRMQQMQQRMESMRQMHMRQGDGTQQGEPPGGMQGMQGMRGMGQRDQACLASSAQGGLSALLMGSTADLALTEEQTQELQQILADARTEALNALTEEQREQLGSAPAAAPPRCQATGQGAPAN